MTVRLRVYFHQPGGRVDTIFANPGQSLLDAARDADISEIGGFCGGICACVQCMIRIDADWIAATGQPETTEAAMLRLGGDPGSGLRLACQIRLTGALAGLKVHLIAPQD